MNLPFPLYYQIIKPKEQSIKATLLVVHGMQEHGGRYEYLAERFAKQGILVLLYDQLGHGKTVQNEQEFGFFTLKEPKEQLIHHALQMAKYLEENYPEIPHFILGHSMGSFVTRCLLQNHAERFDGAFIIGTGSRIIGVKMLSHFLTLFNLIAPKRRSKLLNFAFAKMNNFSFRNETNTHYLNWLSLDKNNRDEFLKDPLCGIPFTVNGFYTLIQLQLQATNKNWAKNISKTFPIYLISGENDPIGNFGKGVRQVYNELLQNGFQQVKMTLYPEMRHEILNEVIKDEVIDEIISSCKQLIETKKLTT